MNCYTYSETNLLFIGDVQRLRLRLILIYSFFILHYHCTLSLYTITRIKTFYFLIIATDINQSIGTKLNTGASFNGMMAKITISFNSFNKLNYHRFVWLTDQCSQILCYHSHGSCFFIVHWIGG